MKFVQITPIKDSLYQDLTLNLTIGKETKRVILELRYLEKTDRWYVSMFDAQRDHTYFMNIPLLASTLVKVNDLFAPFSHKRIGMLGCFPNTDNVTTENPSKDNLSDFIIVCSDGIAE